MFHILWPILTISLALFVFVTEVDRDPNGLSILGAHTLDGRVQVLRNFAREDQPPAIPLLDYAFRVMAGIGFWLALLAAWTLWTWQRSRWSVEGLIRSRWLVRAWVPTLPLPDVAVESGWIAREVGRQPWVIYGSMRTEHAVSAIQPGAVAGSVALYLVFYAVLLTAFTYFASRWFVMGADLTEMPAAALQGFATAPEKHA